MEKTREERIRLKLKEIERLKRELKKAKNSYMRTVLIDEIRAVAHQIEQLKRI